jgi:hypothetical protein
MGEVAAAGFLGRPVPEVVEERCLLVDGRGEAFLENLHGAACRDPSVAVARLEGVVRRPAPVASGLQQVLPERERLGPLDALQRQDPGGLDKQPRCGLGISLGFAVQQTADALRGQVCPEGDAQPRSRGQTGDWGDSQASAGVIPS